MVRADIPRNSLLGNDSSLIEYLVVICAYAVDLYDSDFFKILLQ
jgi:hypothetical protein